MSFAPWGLDLLCLATPSILCCIVNNGKDSCNAWSNGRCSMRHQSSSKANKKEMQQRKEEGHKEESEGCIWDQRLSKKPTPVDQSIQEGYAKRQMFMTFFGIWPLIFFSERLSNFRSGVRPIPLLLAVSSSLRYQSAQLNSGSVVLLVSVYCLDENRLIRQNLVVY